MMLILFVSAAIVVCGLIAVVTGVRGRRLDMHPTCRKCGYDLSGSAAVPGNCPECGRDLAARTNAVRIGTRRRNRPLIVVGAVTMLLAIVGGGWLSYQNAQGFDWNTVKPVWWLRGEIDSADPAVADAARVELFARIKRDELTDAQKVSLIDPILSLQANADLPWQEEWGAYFEEQWLAGKVTDAQLETYLTNAAVTGLTLQIRDRMRQGSWVAFGMPFSARTARESLFSIAWTAEEASFAGIDLMDEFRSSRGEWNVHRCRPSGAGGRYIYFTVDAPLGTHTVDIRLRVTAGQGTTSMPTVGEQPFEPPLIDTEIILTAQVEVVPEDEQVLNIIDTPEMREAIRATLSHAKPQLRMEGDGEGRAFGEITCIDPPIDFSARVYCRIDGEEYVVTMFQAGLDDTHSYMRREWHASPRIALDGRPEQVDVVVRASLERAETFPHILNDTPVWVGEIVFEDVEFDFLGADETPYPTIESDEALAEFLQAVHIRAIEFRQVGDTVSIMSDGGFMGIPYSYAYAVTLRSGDQTWPGSASAVRAGGSHEFFFGNQKVSAFPAGLATIDVVFAPNVGFGASTFGEDDVVLNREFVIEDVPVEWMRE